MAIKINGVVVIDDSKNASVQSIDATNVSTVSANSNTLPALTITQEGTANALEVRDVLNDTTPFKVDASGNVTISGDITVAGSTNLQGQVLGSVDWSNVVNKPDPLITVSLTGDVTGSGSATLTDLGNGSISIATTVGNNTVTLGTDTEGNYVATVTGTTNQVNVSGSGSETAAVTLSLPQDIHTGANPSFAGATLDAVRIGITAANEIDTTSGNLILDSTGGTVTVDDNLTVTGNLTVQGTTTIVDSNTVFSDNIDATKQLKLELSGISTATTRTLAVPNTSGTIALTSDINNATLTVAVSGTGLSLSADPTFTSNASAAKTITVTSNATNANTASTIVARDGSGNFSAGTITAALSGNATTSTTSTQLSVPDTRATATTPETLNGPLAKFDFKSNTTESLSDGGTYFGEMSFRAYGSGNDWTGNKAHQLGFTDNGNIWHRSGTSTTWGSWSKVFESDDATSSNTANALVIRDGSGNFSAGTITASLSGNASTASTLATARTISLTGDVTGSVSFNGGADVSIAATIAADSVALGTDTTGNYVATIAGTTNQVNVSGSGSETAAVTLSLPQNIHTGATPTFGGAALNVVRIGITANGEIDTSSGNLTIDSAGGTVTVDDNLSVSGDLTVTGNLTINGTTTTVNSTTITVDDPIFTLGGDTAPASDDNKDRGIEFRWHNGTVTKVGFFGFDDSTGKFTFIPDATNTSEVFSGTKGTVDANVEWADVLNKPDPQITVSLTGDVTASAVTTTLTDLGNGSISLTTDYAAGSIVNNDISASASIAISKLAASTISGVSLGNNLNTLTIGTGLSGSSYNGSSAVTIAIDSTVATLTGTQTLTNKTFTDSTTFFQDETDNSKKLQLQLSGISTATTRTLTVPNASGTIALTSDLPTVNNATLTVGVSGTGLSLSATPTFTANASADKTITITSNATNANTASTIVARDASGNFSAGTITAALSGNASTATTLQTSRTLWGQSFNGSSNVTGNLTSVGNITGTGAIEISAPGAGNYIKFLTAGATAASIDSNGNFNIGDGSLSSSSKVHAYNTVSGVVSTSVSNFSTSAFSYASSIVTSGALGSSVTTFVTSHNSGEGRIGTESNHSLRLYTNNTEKVAITTAGNVGIGVISPGVKLDVIGEIRASDSSTSGSGTIALGRSSTATNNYHVVSGGDGSFKINNGNIGAGTTAFEINSFNVYVPSRNVYLETGSLGIGTTPSYKLDIAGGSLSSASSSERMIQRLSCTTSNSDNLEIGMFRTSTGSTWESAGWRLQRKIDSSYHGYIQFGGTNSGDVVIGAGNSNTRSSVSEKMRLYDTATGSRVRVGTSSANSELFLGGGFGLISSTDGSTTFSFNIVRGASSTDPTLFSCGTLNGVGLCNILPNGGIAGFGNSTAVYALNVYNTPKGASSRTVCVDTDGRLTSDHSTRRIKMDIQDMEDTTNLIMSLKPRTFLLRKRINGEYVETPQSTSRQMGFIAEEVVDVEPDLCTFEKVRDETGNVITRPDGVQHLQFLAPAIKFIQQLKIEIDELKAEIADLKSSR